MIRFLTELLVRRTWFGQFEEFTCSQLACSNEMQASARTCGRQHDRKCRLKSSQYTLIILQSQGNSTTISLWVSEARLRLPQVNKFPPKRVKDTVIHFYFFLHPQESSALSQSEEMFVE